MSLATRIEQARGLVTVSWVQKKTLREEYSADEYLRPLWEEWDTESKNLAKHGGPGPHTSGSPQSVHGNRSSSAPAPAAPRPDLQVTEGNVAEFYAGFAEARRGKHGAFLSDYDEAWFSQPNVRVFTAHNGSVGGALTDLGDGRIEIGSLFSLTRGRSRPEGAPPGAGRELLRHLIAQGGNWLNNFDGPLTELYLAEGFQVDTRDPWNEEYAPPDWDYDVFGRPAYVTMSRGAVEKRVRPAATAASQRGHLGADAPAQWRRVGRGPLEVPRSPVGVGDRAWDDRPGDGPGLVALWFNEQTGEVSLGVQRPRKGWTRMTNTRRPPPSARPVS